MDIWFYVDNARNRQGPVSAEAVASAFAAGQVHDDSLVWREGLAQWAPLRQFRDELGMGPPMAPAGIAAAAPPPAEARKGNTGCLLIGLVVGIGALVTVGILAAIALPAYQDYLIRSKVSSALHEARAISVAVLEYQQTHARCPTSFEELGVPQPRADGSLEMTLVSLGEARCVIEVPLEGLHDSSALVDRRLYLSLDESGTFSCSTDLDQAKYQPAACR